MTDPAGLRLRELSTWLSTHVPDFDIGAYEAVLLAGGRSNVSYRLTDSQGHSVVLRRPPLGNIMPTAHDMSRDFRVLTGLHSVGFPVPQPLDLCEDLSVIGAPFMVMNFVDGVVIDKEESARNLNVHQGDAISAALIDTLAQLHAIDPATAGLENLGRPDGYLQRQVVRWGQQWQLTKTRELNDIDVLHSHLLAAVDKVRSQSPGCVVHGDYRIDNVILGRNLDAAHINAVVDWEMATLGDPLADLGIALVYWTQIDDGLRNDIPVAEHITDGPGFWTRDQLVQRYCATTGWDAQQIGTYIALACFKLAVIMESIHKRDLEGLQLGAAASMPGAMGRATEALARLGVETIKAEARDAVAALRA